MRTIFATVAELAGIASITVGLWLVAPVLGLVAAGVGLIVVGLAIDPPSPRPPRPGS